MRCTASGLFVVLLGIDGSGKSTALQRIKALEPNWRVTSASPRDLYPIEALPHMDYTLKHHPRNYVWSLPPLSRAAFLASAVITQYEFHVHPALSEGYTVISDSYYYRFLAREEILNPQGAVLLERMVEFLPHPDLVIMLDIDPEQALARKANLSMFESRDGTAATYVEFQRDVLRRLPRMLDEAVVRTIDACRPAPEVCADLHRVITVAASGKRSD